MMAVAPVAARPAQAPETPTDSRRITEQDPALARLKARTIRQLTASVKQLVRDLRPGSGVQQGEAQSQFIHRHVAILRAAYLAAHREGQRDYYGAVSRAPGRWAKLEPDNALVARRMAFYAPSVARMAHEAALAANAARMSNLREPESTATIRLYNPNHDPHTGEFTTGGAGAGPGARASGLSGLVSIRQAIELAKGWSEVNNHTLHGLYLRWSYGQHSVGDKLPPSREYIDGIRTGVQLAGTSVLRIDGRFTPIDLDIGGYEGHVYLVRGERLGSGVDHGEVIIDDATVVAQLAREPEISLTRLADVGEREILNRVKKWAEEDARQRESEMDKDA